MAEFERIYNVLLDVNLPEELKEMHIEQFEEWREGEVGWTQDIEGKVRSGLYTMYEHIMLIHSGVGVPPDPFKPLCAQGKEANLGAIIKARREDFSPGEEFKKPLADLYVENFYELTGLPKADDYNLVYNAVLTHPEISPDGRVRIPKVVGVEEVTKKKGDDGKRRKETRRLELNNEILAKLYLRKTKKLPLGDNATMTWVFDYDQGLKIIYNPEQNSGREK